MSEKPSHQTRRQGDVMLKKEVNELSGASSSDVLANKIHSRIGSQHNLEKSESQGPGQQEHWKTFTWALLRESNDLITRATEWPYKHAKF